MSERYDHGPLVTYEIIWRSGHVERIEAHQVLWPQTPSILSAPATDATPRVLFHGSFDGRWRLVLVADEADLLSVRDVSAQVPK